MAHSIKGSTAQLCKYKLGKPPLTRVRNSLGPVIGYHGCDRAVGEKLLLDQTPILGSVNDYDWLGSGAYFWVDSPERGLQWALEQKKRGKYADACVVGAYIQLGLCLNLTDYGVLEEIREAYTHLRAFSETSNQALPSNEIKRDGVHLKRPLDALVINTVHFLRKERGQPAYDTVYGVFEEGPPLYPGAGFKEKTHIQVAVRNLNECLLGFFRVPSSRL